MFVKVFLINIISQSIGEHIYKIYYLCKNVHNNVWPIRTHLFNSVFSCPAELVPRERGVRPHRGDVAEPPRHVLQRDPSTRHALEHIH